MLASWFRGHLLVVAVLLLLANQKVNAHAVDEESLVNATLQVIKNHVIEGEIDEALNKFLKLNDRDAVVADMVREAYNGSKENLFNTILFTDKLENLNLKFNASDTLFKEMKKSQHLSEKEVLYEYCALDTILNSSEFRNLTDELKEEFLTLRNKFEEQKNFVLESLADDIKQNHESQRSKDVYEMFKNRYSDCLIPELAQKLISLPNIEFKSLIIHSRTSTTNYNQRCIFLGELNEALKSLKQDSSLNEIVIWTVAKSLIFNTTKGNISTNIDVVNCKAIYDQPPSSRQHFRDEYLSKVEQRSFEQLNEWHNDFYEEMRWFLANEVIQDLPENQMRGKNADNWAEFIDQLPWMEDICLAAKVVFDQLTKLKILNYQEHFRIAHIANRMIASNVTLEDQYQEMCTIVKNSVPPVFQNIILGKAGNCRLINMRYLEPLYCAERSRPDIHERKIYTFVRKNDDEDQYWNLEIASSFNGRVSFLNNYHKHSLRHLEDDVLRGSGGDWEDRDYFRVQAVGNNSLRIESSIDGTLLMATNEKERHFEHNRYVRMKHNYRNSLDTVWRIDCKHT